MHTVVSIYKGFRRVGAQLVPMQGPNASTELCVPYTSFTIDTQIGALNEDALSKLKPYQ